MNVKKAKPSESGAVFRQVMRSAGQLFRPYRAALIAAVALMCVSRTASLALPLSTKYFLDEVLVRRISGVLPLLVGVVLLAAVVQGVCSCGMTLLLTRAGQRLVADLRGKVYAHMLELPIAFYDSQKVGQLSSRVMDDVESVRNLFGAPLVEFIGACLAAAFSLALLLRLSPFMTLVAISLVSGYFLIAQFLLRRIQPWFQEQSVIRAGVAGRLTESLGGIRVIKGYHAESREKAVFTAGLRSLLASSFKPLGITSMLNGSTAVVTALIAALVMAIGAGSVHAGRMTIGELGAFIVLLALVVSPIFQLAGLGSQLAQAYAAMHRTQLLLNEAPETAASARQVPCGLIDGVVEFERVSFSYEPGRPVLHDLSFRAVSGAVTALVGPSGSGKSTIISLIAAFHSPCSGRITVDGKDLSTLRLDSYRTQLGVVLQEVFLFDGTIWENVLFSRPDASQSELIEACRVARVDEFALSFPQGYRTVVGERGVRLSGGQKQRISIARAVLANPRILILDEATSSLDTESETFVQEGLQYLMQNRTTFVIAHRLSTVRQADQILVLDGGRIRESGTHRDLLASRARYYDLYINQHGISEVFAPPRGQYSEPGDAPEIDLQPTAVSEGV